MGWTLVSAAPCSCMGTRGAAERSSRSWLWHIILSLVLEPELPMMLALTKLTIEWGWTTLRILLCIECWPASCPRWRKMMWLYRPSFDSSLRIACTCCAKALRARMVDVSSSPLWPVQATGHFWQRLDTSLEHFRWWRNAPEAPGRPRKGSAIGAEQGRMVSHLRTSEGTRCGNRLASRLVIGPSLRNLFCCRFHMNLQERPPFLSTICGIRFI